MAKHTVRQTGEDASDPESWSVVGEPVKTAKPVKEDEAKPTGKDK
jgi:hypothetical protein